MPIYEYRCAGCRRRVSIWWKTLWRGGGWASRSAHAAAATELSRLMSRVAVLRSEESRLDDMADPAAFGDLDENDPRSIGRWMRRMSAEMGEDLGDEMSEVVDRLEAGESPESIEESMPDLGAGGWATWSDLDQPVTGSQPRPEIGQRRPRNQRRGILFSNQAHPLHRSRCRLHRIHRLARVHQQPAARLGRGHLQIAGPHPLVIGQRLLLHAVPLAGVVVGVQLLAPQPGLRVDVQVDHQVGPQPAGGKGRDHPQRGQIQPTAVALVGQRGIGVAVAQHHAAARQMRPDHLAHVLGAGRGEEQHLGLGLHLAAGRVQQNRPHAVADGRAARLARQEHILPAARAATPPADQLRLLPLPSGPSKVMNMGRGKVVDR